jgi:protein-S-isoprenylcysteine O-methyltransferase Ste14
MNVTISQSAEKRLQLVIDFGERLFILLLFAAFVVRLSHSLFLRPYNLLALLSEGLVVFFIIVRRRAIVMSLRPMDWAAAFLGTALPMFVRPGGTPLIPAYFGTALMFVGLSLAIWAKLNIRKSFGLAAANRGPVHAGPYSVIRHPMYAGYIAVYIGFLLNNPLPWNLLIYTAGALMQITRIYAEEAVLRHDPAYCEYQSRVRYRLLPRLF